MDSFLILSFIAGAIIGSFLNVMGLRLLREEDFIKKPSYCYSCEHRLSWLDMIPLLSFVLLRGKCRYCQAKLSFQYWAIELLTASLFALTYYYFGMTLQTLLLMYLFANLIVILITDFREQYIFDINSIGLIPCGLLFAGLEGWHPQLGWPTIATDLFHFPVDLSTSLLYPFLQHLAIFEHSLYQGGWPGVGGNLFNVGLALFLSWAMFFVLNFFSRLIFKTDGFGEGDTRLLMGLATFLGLEAVAIILISSVFLQAVLVVPMMFVQWLQKGRFKILSFFLGAFLLGLAPYALQQIEALSTFQRPIAIVCALAALFFAFKAIKLSRESTDELTYIPFGPAICLAVGLYVFFSRIFVSG